MKKQNNLKNRNAKSAFSLAQAMVLMFIVGSLLFFSVSMTNMGKYSNTGNKDYEYVQTAEGDYFKNKLEDSEDEETGAKRAKHIETLASFHFDKANDEDPYYDYMQIRIYSIEEIIYRSCQDGPDNDCEDADKCGEGYQNCEPGGDGLFYYKKNGQRIIEAINYSEDNLIYNSADSNKGNLPETSESVTLKVEKIND